MTNRHRLGEFELMVLLATLQLGKREAYAVSIADEIAARTGRPAKRAAVYVALQRLERKQLVASELGQPTAERGGKARREVRVTAAGRQAVADTQAALRSLWTGLGEVLPAPRGGE